MMKLINNYYAISNAWQLNVKYVKYVKYVKISFIRYIFLVTLDKFKLTCSMCLCHFRSEEIIRPRK